MKKLILTSATLLFLGFNAIADDGGKCCKKDGKKCETTACKKDDKCKDKEKCCVMAENGNMNCKKESKDCCLKKIPGATEVK